MLYDASGILPGRHKVKIDSFVFQTQIYYFFICVNLRHLRINNTCKARI